LKAHELRTKTQDELKQQLEEAKRELAEARVAKVVQSNQTKIAKIGGIRKNIARILTVYNTAVRNKQREASAGSKFLNKDLRAKKTRAIRRRLTKEQKFVTIVAQPLTDKSGAACKKLALRRTVKATKKAANFPQRVYAVKA